MCVYICLYVCGFICISYTYTGDIKRNLIFYTVFPCTELLISEKQ